MSVWATSGELALMHCFPLDSEQCGMTTSGLMDMMILLLFQLLIALLLLLIFLLLLLFVYFFLFMDFLATCAYIRTRQEFQWCWERGDVVEKMI